ncbi:MAG: hypothetical protein A2V88_02750 [Elusimicrobia bacterium RBG_16_66_12]|nr:MAG: hypothetical protein A2V88_02750 [Elusimicrobia bacterium RBG_16_66_12]
MEQIGDDLRDVLENIAQRADGWPQCGRCSVRVPVIEEGLCGPCAEAVAVAADVTGRLAWYVDRMLRAAGLSRRELGATRDGVPPPIRAALKRCAEQVQLQKLADGGEGIEAGFGLSGPAGIGKTFALVAIFRQATAARVSARVGQIGSGALKQWIAWATWPEWVNRMRVESMKDGGTDTVQRWVERFIAAEALVLDDLGAERMKGDYTDDWCGSLLDLLIDRRHRDIRPTWYTTNLGPVDFAERYGARMFSRLCGGNPMVEIERGPDIRLVKLWRA